MKVETNVEPKFDWVVVTEEVVGGDETVTAGGLILKSGMSEGVRRGTVVAVGCGRVLECGQVVPPQTGPGARIIYQDVGHVFFVGQTPYRAIKEQDIICEVGEAQ